MPPYTPESKDRVRDAVDFVGLVSERTDLRRAGSQWMGLCPFHEERSPSFSVDPVKKVYNCFGCGERGDVFTFVEKTHGLDFTQALEFLADRTHIELERAVEDPETERRRAAQDRLRALLSRAAQFYAAYLWKAAEAEPARPRPPSTDTPRRTAPRATAAPAADPAPPAAARSPGPRPPAPARCACGPREIRAPAGSPARASSRRT